MFRAEAQVLGDGYWGRKEGSSCSQMGIFGSGSDSLLLMVLYFSQTFLSLIYQFILSGDPSVGPNPFLNLCLFQQNLSLVKFNL